MKRHALHIATDHEETMLMPTANAPLALPEVLGAETAGRLERMFRDPRLLEPEECADLITQLRSATALAPHVPEVRVLLGMALCVDLQAQEALEELREATRQAPDCFIARLKFGELLMRLRICRQAEEETHKAAQLASNPVQSELARRQATMIRTMLREGIERGGYGGVFKRLLGMRRKAAKTGNMPALVSSK
ncbi:MAG TPA: hypothetical protein VND90_13310 [Terracidiphilus sp.]|nr:hypothetical protein [Terracidiphilus sp.]